jgi:hypothetical protein
MAQKFQQEHQPEADSAFAQGSRENGGIWWRETGDLALAASFDHLGALSTLLRPDSATGWFQCAAWLR